jgi:hypothetical protein
MNILVIHPEDPTTEFASLVNRYFDCADISSRVVDEYVLNDNPVADFNRERIYPCQESFREIRFDAGIVKELAQYLDCQEDDMDRINDL